MENTFNKNEATVSTAPCKNCPMRKIGCHAECLKYFAYKLEIELVKREKQNEKDCKNYFGFCAN